MTASIAAPLLAWYDAQKRDLPWRRSTDAYAVWISEIMLQQTRVSAVIAYYQRFLAGFPNVQSLAQAGEQQVLAHWSGLGYYQRARRMHQAAKSIVADHGGKFPATAEELRKLPGIGRYTAAAIASIVFAEPLGVVDGNVERVLTRLHGAALASSQCWNIVEELLDKQRPGDFNQAMMELGATVCTPKSPGCSLCPVREMCATQGEHPTPPQAPRKIAELRYLLRVRTRPAAVLMTQRAPAERLMPSMWELPKFLSAPGEPAYRLRHSITNTDYQVLVFKSNAKPRRNTQWIRTDALPSLALTGLSRKILKKANILDLWQR